MVSSTGKIPRYIIGFVSMGVCTYFLVTQWDHQTIFLSSSFLLLICVTDTFYSKIPNLLTVALMTFGATYHFFELGMDGLLLSGLGFIVGLALFVLPYALGGMAAGDVKALAALGAVVGPGAIFQVFLYTGLIGGALAILFASFDATHRNKVNALMTRAKLYLLTRDVQELKPSSEPGKRERTFLSFPYATAIAFGFFSFVHWGRLI